MTKFKVILATLVTAAASVSWGLNASDSWTTILNTYWAQTSFPSYSFGGVGVSVYNTCVENGNIVATVLVCKEGYYEYTNDSVIASEGNYSTGRYVCTRSGTERRSMPMSGSNTQCYSNGGGNEFPDIGECSRPVNVPYSIARNYQISVFTVSHGNEFSDVNTLFVKPFSIPDCQ